MTTYYSNDAVYRQAKTGTRPGGVSAPSYLLLPEGNYDLTIYAKGSAAATALIEETSDATSAVVAGTATWTAVDSTLNSVGTTQVRYLLAHTPVALRVTALVSGETATLVLIGKKSV